MFNCIVQFLVSGDYAEMFNCIVHFLVSGE